MASDDPSWYNLFQSWIYQNYGIFGSALVAMCAAAFFLWWNWADIRARPGVSAFLDWFNTRSLPKLDQGRFSILVARLEHDDDRKIQRLVIEALAEFPGIQVISVDQMIAPKARSVQQREQNGHREAQEWLKDSSGTVVIWGTVLQHGDLAVPKLWWTIAQGGLLSAGRYAPQADHALRLPELFWTDLRKVLNLVVAQQVTEIHSIPGQIIADSLPKFIGRVRELVSKPPEIDFPRNKDAIARTRLLLALALQKLGEQTGSSAALKEAMQHYDLAIQATDVTSDPITWAEAQSNLGSAIGTLGSQTDDQALLHDSVMKQNAALTVYSRERFPMVWAGIQNNIAGAFSELGRIEGNPQHVQTAISSFRLAAEVFTKDASILDWGMIQLNLANAFEELGEISRNSGHFVSSIDMYKAALTVFTEERAPLLWAHVLSNMSVALTAYGRVHSERASLLEAISACEKALTVLRRDAAELDWARTLINFANAQATLGELEADIDRLESAELKYQSALDVISRGQHDFKWAILNHNMGRMLVSISKLRKSEGHLTKALQAFCAAEQAFVTGGFDRYAKESGAAATQVREWLAARE
jgi:tetratricopeptide (TPR) repeat protein